MELDGMEYTLTDLHSHILPGVDDGSPNMQTSMEMLAISYQEGVRDLFLTPHYIRRQNQYQPEELDRIYEQLQKAASAEFPELNLYLGNEIYYTPGISEDIRNGQIHSMNGSRYVLVEFAVGITWTEMYQAMKELIRARVWPVIAHVERYRCLVKQMKHIDELREMEVYLQLNAEGLLGSFFDADTRWRRTLVKEGKISFLGTDAHDLNHRAPYIKDAAKWMQQKTTSDYSRKLLHANGQAVVEKRYL